MDLAEIYSTSRSRLLELALSLPPDRLDAPLPATPPWTVLDGYRHLTGVCSDVLDGSLDDAGSPAWTAAQLAARGDRSLAEVCAEWAQRGPQLDARLAAAGTSMAFVAFDAWTHGQDIRAGVGQSAIPDEDLVISLALVALATFGRRYASCGAPTVRVVIGSDEHVLGDGDPAATLYTTAYELLRIIFGRRSRAQVEAAGWSDASAAAIEAIHLFDFPEHDIID